MADYVDCERDLWGHPRTSKDVLDEYWEELLKKADFNEKDEIKFFCHCTTLTGKKGIEQTGCLIGGSTNLPARAPLASYEGLKGIWLAPALKELPKRSPYGSQRMTFRIRDVMAYLGQDFLDANDDDDDDEKWEATETGNDRNKPSTNKKGKNKGDRKGKNKQQSNRKQQKDCYLKHKVPEKVQLRDPLLFFECAHYFGSNQYIRLLLVRDSDPKADWCREFCKELELRNNPFLEFHFGRIWTYSYSKDGKYDIVVEVLVVGDIVFDRLEQPPSWDVVGTMSRSGFDPRLGIC